MLKNGTQAPEFDLEDQEGKQLFVVPLEGNIVGSSEGPALFQWSFLKKLEEWLFRRKESTHRCQQVYLYASRKFAQW